MGPDPFKQNTLNLSLLKKLEDHDYFHYNNIKPINIGTCGLHVIHNSFRARLNVTGWDVSSFLTILFKLFDDIPTRHADYLTCVNSKIFFLQFCSHRWVDNVNVYERAIELTDVKLYNKSLDKKKFNKLGSKSFFSCISMGQRSTVLCTTQFIFYFCR